MVRNIITICLLALILGVGSAAAFFWGRDDGGVATTAENAITTEIDWDSLVPQNAYTFLEDPNLPDSAWEDPVFLAKLDAADKLIVDELNGQSVALPGFMVPLEYEGNMVTEFLLVPQAAACVHVPPPPQNQIVHVKSKSPVRFYGMFEPMVVTGLMSTKKVNTELAESGYAMQANGVRFYMSYGDDDLPEEVIGVQDDRGGHLGQ